ncbi:Ribonuclease T2 precursor (RNase T2) [Podila minutissima]|nr:Ribonuclease T2 precursor (RNase T2) [Podila minutissima]
MYKYWPSYQPNVRNPDFNRFWSHEWGWHGTCVSTLGPSCMDEDMAVYKYFNKGLELREEYDIHAALAAHNITPGETRYSVDDMINAIEQELKNQDQYKPVKRPDGTSKAEGCPSGMVYFQQKST